MKDDSGATALRECIGRSDFQNVHAGLLVKLGIIKSVAQIIRNSHAFKTTLRSSAAYVTRGLFDVVSSAIMEILTPSGDPEDAKMAVSLALEAHKEQASHQKNSVNTTPQVDPDYRLSLGKASLDRDPTASMLMGQTLLASGMDADKIKKVKLPFDH